MDNDSVNQTDSRLLKHALSVPMDERLAHTPGEGAKSHHRALSTNEGALLTLLGSDLAEPLRALLSEIHRLDREHSDDDSVARLVAIGCELNNVLEPVAALSRLSAAKPGAPSAIDIGSALERVTAERELAASFGVNVHGELGESFDHRERLEDGLTIFLNLIAGASRTKIPLQVSREVRASSDCIVVAARVASRTNGSQELRRALLPRLAALMGATLELEEDESEGLVLSLEIPVLRKPETAPSAAGPVLAFRREMPVPEESENGEPARVVLIVESEPAARGFMSRVLELEGFEVVPTASLADAYERAHTFRPHVITIDHMELMRDREGWGRRFTSDPVLARVPVVLIQSPETDTATGPVAAATVVWKPIDPAKLVEAIKRQAGNYQSTLLVVGSKDEHIKLLVAGERFRVVTSRTASEGQRLLQTMTPSAVICDVHSVQGSMSFLEELRREQRTRGVPAVAIHLGLTEQDRLRLQAMDTILLSWNELTPAVLKGVLLELTGEGRLSDAGAS